MSPDPAAGTLDRLYDFISGDEDARVCKEIPESACRHQPRNFFAYLTANLLNKVDDELTSAKLVLPWLILLLALASLVAAVYARQLPEVSG